MSDAAPTLQRAHELARLGYRVFPVNAHNKLPRIHGGHGCKDATKDAEQLKTWWSEYPEARVAIATGEGLVVFDGDSYKAEFDAEAWSAIAEQLQHAPMQTTPSGGTHLFARIPEGVECHGGNDVLGRYIDRKAKGGYVLDYGVELGAPDEMVESSALLCTANKTRATNGTATNDTSRHGAVLSALRGARTPADVRRVLEGDEAAGIVSARGASGLREIARMLPEDATALEPFAPKSLDLDRVLIEPVAPIPWVYKPWMAEGDRVMIAADGGVGKSALALDLALALTTGGDWLGAENKTGPSRVVYLDEEMPEQLARRRIQLLAKTRNIDSTRLRYFCEAGFNLDDGATHAALEEQLAWAGEERGVLILDALIRFHRRQENVNDEMAALFGLLRPMLKKAGVGLLTLHHEAKSLVGGGGRSGQQKARGASDIANAHDVTISYERDGDRRVLRLNKSRWWMGSAETWVDGLADDQGNLIGLEAADVGTALKNIVGGKLAVAAERGALRANLITEVMDEQDIGKSNAERQIGRALKMLDVVKRPEGKAVRYWIKNSAPEGLK